MKAIYISNYLMIKLLKICVASRTKFNPNNWKTAFILVLVVLTFMPD